MKKNVIIAALVVALLVAFTSGRQMTDRAVYWMNRCDAAEAYIEALERDFPDYIDTTSGVDEYSKYYKYK